MNNRKKKYIVHVGASGIPLDRTASTNRCIALYNLLIDVKVNILAINSKYHYLSEKDSLLKIKREGNERGISYTYTSPYLYKPNNPIKRKISKSMGMISTCFLLVKLKFKKKIDLIFFYPQGDFLELVCYRIFSKIFKIPIIGHYVEFRSAFKSRKGIWTKINDYLFDRYFMFLIDGVIPISEFLIKQIEERRKGLPILKVLPLVDFKLFSERKRTINKKYFLYVGSSAYHEAIRIIIDAFGLINNQNYYLYLILHDSKIDLIRNEIKNHPKKDLIKIYSNLDYTELIDFYNNAISHLIPLSDSLQDRARFPNKIAEYLASKKPIITTNYGEIPFYFKDKVNALIAKKNEAIELADKMMYVINNPKESKIIGLKGHELGLTLFDSNSYNFKLKKFIYAYFDKSRNN